MDLKGVVYLAGVILACLFTALVGTFPGLQDINSKTKLPNSRYNVCRLVEFTGGPISYLPLGMTILSFTFFYLGYTVVKYQLYERNALMIAMFILLISNDFIYNITHGCAKSIILFVSLVIGASIGMLWGYLIDILGNQKLQLVTGTNLNTTCMRPQKVCTNVKVRKHQHQPSRRINKI
jgi:hypothetical protein